MDSHADGTPSYSDTTSVEKCHYKWWCYNGSFKRHSTPDGPAQVGDASPISPVCRLFADEVAPLYYTKGADITATCIKQRQYEMQIKTAIREYSAVFGAITAYPLGQPFDSLARRVKDTVKSMNLLQTRWREIEHTAPGRARQTTVAV